LQCWLQAAGAEADERPLAELKKPGFKVSGFKSQSQGKYKSRVSTHNPGRRSAAARATHFSRNPWRGGLLHPLPVVGEFLAAIQAHNIGFGGRLACDLPGSLPGRHGKGAAMVGATEKRSDELEHLRPPWVVPDRVAPRQARGWPAVVKLLLSSMTSGLRRVKNGRPASSR
jgi:hypothetical protein